MAHPLYFFFEKCYHNLGCLYLCIDIRLPLWRRRYLIYGAGGSRRTAVRIQNLLEGESE